MTAHHRLLLSLALCLIVSACTHSALKTEPSGKTTIEWSTEESRERFARSQVKGDFFLLASYFEPQATKFACGPTTGTIVLNALLLRDEKTEKPVDPTVYPLKKNYVGDKFTPAFSKFTQNTFFDAKTEAVKPRDVYYGKTTADGRRDGGLQLDQFGRMLETHGVSVRTRFAENPETAATFKNEVLEALKDETSFVVVNFDRKVLGQNGGGHISPVVAYDSLSDSFLVLDVNPVVSEWFWVKSDLLFAAMNTKDADHSRGYLIVSRR